MIEKHFDYAYRMIDFAVSVDIYYRSAFKNLTTKQSQTHFNEKYYNESSLFTQTKNP